MGGSRRSSVQKYHDRVAGKYDESYTDAYWAWHDSLTWDYLKPFLPRNANAKVVDLGCGTGKWGARIARSGYPVTSVDISPKMLDQARRKLEDAAGPGQSEFIQADLTDLRALPAGEFALAIALGDPIGCTSSPPKCMKEIRRILTNEGVLVATFDNRLAAVDFYLSRGDERALDRFLRDGKTHWLTRDAGERFLIHTYGPTELRALVESTGFEMIDLVGLTVLPLRHYRALLSKSPDRRRLAKTEKRLSRDLAAMGRASHLQVACRVIPR